MVGHPARAFEPSSNVSEFRFEINGRFRSSRALQLPGVSGRFLADRGPEKAIAPTHVRAERARLALIELIPVPVPPHVVANGQGRQIDCEGGNFLKLRRHLNSRSACSKRREHRNEGRSTVYTCGPHVKNAVVARRRVFGPRIPLHSDVSRFRPLLSHTNRAD